MVPAGGTDVVSTYGSYSLITSNLKTSNLKSPTISFSGGGGVSLNQTLVTSNLKSVTIVFFFGGGGGGSLN